MNGLLCLNMLNQSGTVVNFYVKDILECLKGKGTINKTMLVTSIESAMKFEIQLGTQGERII